MTGFRYKSNIEKVLKSLDKGKDHNLRAAASHVRRKMRKKLGKRYGASTSPEGGAPGKRLGNLRKGVKIFVDAKNDTAYIGMGPPAYHAHLLEFGTLVRKQKKTGRTTGEQKARPFFVPTFEEEDTAVMSIMREPWIK